MVENFGLTTCCLSYKGLRDIHGNRYEEGNAPLLLLPELTGTTTTTTARHRSHGLAAASSIPASSAVASVVVIIVCVASVVVVGVVVVVVALSVIALSLSSSSSSLSSSSFVAVDAFLPPRIHPPLPTPVAATGSFIVAFPKSSLSL